MRNFFKYTMIAVAVGAMAGHSAAMAAPIGATAVFVEGKVTVIHADRTKEAVAVGTAFVEGDTVKTGGAGVVEIEYDTGDITRVDKRTTLKIKSLNRDPAGSTFSIFGLIVGRIKSSVSKLVSSESRFEFHTKSAVAGVAGTPPFVVEAIGGVTNVDLLGLPGDPGSVYVQGTDIKQTTVKLLAGQRTVARFNAVPRDPFPISMKRLQDLQRKLQFQSRTDTTAQKKPQRQKVAGAKPDTAQSMVVDSISSSISTFMQPSPSGINSVSKVNITTTTKQGSVGADSGTGAEADQPPPFGTGSISLIFQ